MTLVFRSKEEFEQEIILKSRDGCPIRNLSRLFKISRNTVRRILRTHNDRRETPSNRKPAPKISKLDPFKPEIRRLLDKFPDITGVRMLDELRIEGYSGGISILREYLETIRKLRREPVIRFETAAGLQGQMDWSPYKIKFLRTGKAEVICFSYILGFSRRQFIDFTVNRNFFTLIRCHQAGFSYFGGIPLQCLYDNEKTVVLRWEAGRPVFNPSFTAFITHYKCRPIACRPRAPMTKGKIEAPFRYVEGNLLNAREFQDLEDLRSTAKWWLENVSDQHSHYTTRRLPIELFMAEEKSALQPLPAIPYDSSEVRLVVCHSDGFVFFESNRYSVPTGYIGDILTLKATEGEVKIYSPDLELLAHHPRRARGENQRVEDPSHHSVKKNLYGLEPVREAFLALGEATQEFLSGAVKKFPKNCGFHVRHILKLKEHFLSDDIHKALIHALRFQAFDGKSIERILMARAKPRTLESIRNDKASERLASALPQITQRSLEEYGELLEEKEISNEGTRNPGENKESPQYIAPEKDDGVS